MQFEEEIEGGRAIEGRLDEEDDEEEEEGGGKRRKRKSINGKEVSERGVVRGGRWN